MNFSLFHPTEKDQAIAAGARAPFYAELMKKLFLGGGVSIGAAVVFAAIEMLRDDPHDGLTLLKSWGPWAVVALFALFVVYDITKMVLDIGKRGVIAVEGLSASVKQIAEKDDRQIQELQTLTSFTAREGERSAESLKELHGKVDSLDGKIAELSGVGAKVDTLIGILAQMGKEKG